MTATMDDLDLDEPSGAPILASDVERVVSQIVASDVKISWNTDVYVDLGTKRWRPSAVSSDTSRVLCVCLQDRIPNSTIERLRLARSKGMKLTIAVTIGALYTDEVVSILADTDSDVFVVDDLREERRFSRRHCLAALADIEVPVSPAMRRTIGQEIWSVLEDGTNQEKGRRLEALLAFLFSQVGDLRVAERNYRTETEEIDLVLQIDNFSPHVWHKSGVPFILVEAKNRQDKASQPMMSVLLNKLQTKRGTARIGIMVSLAGFTSDAREQELRFSTQDVCVVMIDSAALERLLASDDLDGELERLVRRSLLR